MNFRDKTKPSQFKYYSIWGVLLQVGFVVQLNSCAPNSGKVPDSGSFNVQIPVTVTQQENSSVRSADGNSVNSVYKLSTVQIDHINNIHFVDGEHAQFYYQPGVVQNQISGNQPRAFFSKNSKNTLIAQDVTTLQMFSIYYIIQTLKEFVGTLNSEITDQFKLTQKPMKVGLMTNVLVKDDTTGAKKIDTNNAFFDGQTESIIFLPYSDSKLALTYNQGVMAHEYFHSLFYSLFLKPIRQVQDQTQARVRISIQSPHENSFVARASKLMIFKDVALRTTETDEDYFNETYIRGINEGLADYFAWIYTNDETFMNWSFTPTPNINIKARDLGLNRDLKNDLQIKTAVAEARKVVAMGGYSSTVSNELSGYIYQIGTPVAIVMKNLTLKVKAEQNLTLKESQKLVLTQIFKNLEQLRQQYLDLQSKQTLNTQFLFTNFFESSIKLGKDSCELLLKNLTTLDSKYKNQQCAVSDNGQYKLTQQNEPVNAK